MAEITHVVESYLDWDRPTLIVDAAWVKRRIEIFEKYTLRSLLGQAFKEFRIFLQCGSRNRAVTEAHAWHPQVETCYEGGAKLYGAIDTDFLAITRIDSDDAFHRHAMAMVQETAARTARRSGKLKRVKYYAFKKNICWDILNHFVIPHIRPSTPFVTRIYPRIIYKNPPLFNNLHFRAHGGGGLGDRQAVEIAQNMVCVIKHGLNTSEFKHGRQHKILTDEEKAQLIITKTHSDEWTTWKVKWILTDKAKMIKILEPFGIPAEEV